MFDRAIAQFRPRPRSRLLEWCRTNVQTGEGRPYDHTAFPHLGAPGGPMDAFDCGQYLTIWLQWASRLGKTFYGQCALMKTADCDPCPLMFASADQKLAVEVTDRTYRMLAKCPPLRDQLRPVHRRKQDLIDLDSCRCFVGWSRSVSTLADKAVRVGHANEIDKWEHETTSKEADPLKLFADRFKEFPSHKRICESTPAQKHSSRVEKGRLASTNCRYWVPCPHCGQYQTLKMQRIEWDKNEAGKSEKDLARRTARYQCEPCGKDIYDQHRGAMMRAGVWVPEGCSVDDAKASAAAKRQTQTNCQPFKGWPLADWITGTPLRDGRDAGYQLSSLYALSLGWGDIAAEWIDCQKNPQNLRNFVNQWLAETWENVKRKATWEEVGKRLIVDKLPRLMVPVWASLLTIGVDRQEDDRYPWIIVAWGAKRRPAVIGYGEHNSLDEMASELFGQTYRHEDGGEPMRIAFGLVDSGYRPDGIYDFCARCYRRGLQVWPSKGSAQALDSDYRQARLGENTSMPGMVLIHVDTIRSQLWLDRVIHDLKPEDGGATIHAGSLAEHQDFLEQILNDAAIAEPGKDNNDRERWQRINANIPNDLRDCWRYAYVAMLIASGGREILQRQQGQPQTRSAVVNAGASRPDGRRW